MNDINYKEYKQRWYRAPLLFILILLSIIVLVADYSDKILFNTYIEYFIMLIPVCIYSILNIFFYSWIHTTNSELSFHNSNICPIKRNKIVLLADLNEARFSLKTFPYIDLFLKTDSNQICKKRIVIPFFLDREILYKLILFLQEWNIKVKVLGPANIKI